MIYDPLFLGIDLGTSSLKAGLFSVHGERSGTIVRLPYPTAYPAPGLAEQNPRHWWQAVIQACQALRLQRPKEWDRIAAIGLCGQARGLVLIDGQGQVLFPAIIWQDVRAQMEAESVRAVFPSEAINKILGYAYTVDATTILPRLLWFHRHQPALLSAASWALTPKDYIIFCLTGVLASDLVSQLSLVDRAGRYRPELLQHLGVPPLQPLQIYQPDSVAGYLSAGAAQDLGLAVNTPVAAGSIDIIASLWGAGITRPGPALEVAGTSSSIALLGDFLQAGEGVSVFPIGDGLFLYGGPTQMGAAALDWIDMLVHLDQPTREGENPGPLLFLPFVGGARSPLWNPVARGVFIGLHHGHTAQHFRKAVMEGIAFNIRHILERCEQAAGYSCLKVRVGGGGAENATWNQIKADILNRPIEQLAESETGVLGAALMAAACVGATSRSEIATIPLVTRTYEPAPARRAYYDELYACYLEGIQQLASVFSRLAAVSPP